MTAVKICGIRDSENLKAATQAGADYIGFVFYAPSPRAVTPQEAAALGKLLPAGIKAVGLFVDAPDHEIASAIQGTNIAMLQLHGAEDPQRVAAIQEKFGLPVIKAIRIGSADDLATVPEYEDASDWLLFDSRPSNAPLPGGTGQVFDWSLLAGRSFKKPWMLSGGLTAQNVAGALSVVSPDAVDVSSGVETAPGIKDAGKIHDFIRAVKTNG